MFAQGGVFVTFEFALISTEFRQKITERCKSGSRAGRAELFFRYFVSVSACFGGSHLSAAHNMEHNSG